MLVSYARQNNIRASLSHQATAGAQIKHPFPRITLKNDDVAVSTVCRVDGSKRQGSVSDRGYLKVFVSASDGHFAQ